MIIIIIAMLSSNPIPHIVANLHPPPPYPIPLHLASTIHIQNTKINTSDVKTGTKTVAHWLTRAFPIQILF